VPPSIPPPPPLPGPTPLPAVPTPPPATPAPRPPSTPPAAAPSLPSLSSGPTQPLLSASSAPPATPAASAAPEKRSSSRPAPASGAPPPRRGLPAWVAIVAFGLGAALGILIASRGSAGRAAQPAAARSAATPSEPRPAASATAAPEPRSVEQRATAGDEDALATLNGITPANLTVEQSFALSRGEIAARLSELTALGEKLKASPDLADDPATLSALLKFARDPQTAIPALELIAAQRRERTTDLLFEIWTGVPNRDTATTLAERLVLSTAVREHASPALAIALALRDVQDCAAATELVAKAAEVGDRRSVRALVRLNGKRGCGDGAREDCFPCLRTVEARRALATAAANAQRRDPPQF